MTDALVRIRYLAEVSPGAIACTTPVIATYTILAQNQSRNTSVRDPCLGIIVQKEFVRMGPEPQRIDFLGAFVAHPGFDDIFSKDAPFE